MERINSQLLKDMLTSGMNNLANHSAEIDALNVFLYRMGIQEPI